MGVVKQTNIKNRTYYFYNDTIDLRNIWCNVIKNWQKIIQKHCIYNIEYITIKKSDNCKNIHSVNPLYLLINHANRSI